MTIDIDALRNDLINYFGTAMMTNIFAQADLIKVESASPEELITIAEKNGFDLSDYEILTK